MGEQFHKGINPGEAEPDWQAAEQILDIERTKAQPDDSILETAARKYLMSRSRRINSDKPAGIRVMYFAHGLMETMRGQRLSKLAQFDFSSSSDRSYYLPSYARKLLDYKPKAEGPE